MKAAVNFLSIPRHQKRGQTNCILPLLETGQLTVLSVACVVLLILASGCSTPQRSVPVVWTGSALADAKTRLELAPVQSKPLFQLEAGTEAIRMGEFAKARNLFDQALVPIGGIFTDDPTAKRARGHFHSENSKLFRGEPYERVMAYYYRGILYWMDGELDNARACFRSGQICDADTGEHRYAADYVMLDYLDGLLTSKLGGDGIDVLERARSDYSDRVGFLPDYDPAANVFFFIESGTGPKKYATGEHMEELRFAPGKSDIARIRLRSATQEWQLWPFDNVTFQATTRGGRVMDHILKNQVVFKEMTRDLGEEIKSGMTRTGWWGDLYVKSDIFGPGLTVLSSLVRSEADTRHWMNLPEDLWFASLRLPDGENVVSFDLIYEDGRTRTETRRLTVREGGWDTVAVVNFPHETVEPNPAQVFEQILSVVADGKLFKLRTASFNYPAESVSNAVLEVACAEGLQNVHFYKHLGILTTGSSPYGFLQRRRYCVLIEPAGSESSKITFKMLEHYIDDGKIHPVVPNDPKLVDTNFLERRANEFLAAIHTQLKNGKPN